MREWVGDAGVGVCSAGVGVCVRVALFVRSIVRSATHEPQTRGVSQAIVIAPRCEGCEGCHGKRGVRAGGGAGCVRV